MPASLSCKSELKLSQLLACNRLQINRIRGDVASELHVRAGAQVPPVVLAARVACTGQGN